MIERYSRKQMARLFTLGAKFDAWLAVEKALVRAWARLGLVPKDSMDRILRDAKFSIERIDELEAELKHDVIAFTTCVGESIGKDSRFFHYGVTSSDIIDTANALLLKQAMAIIIEDVEILRDTLRDMALAHKHTPIIGRSHGVHGEVTSFGLVLLGYCMEFDAALGGLSLARDYISRGKIGGAMGNMPHTSVELEELVCAELGLKPALVSTQVIAREAYARIICELAEVAATAEKLAINIRHMARSEVYEVAEYFAPHQKGSSAMPHKKNPILSENITGLCRMIRAYVTPALEDVALWHERDMSHSSVERMILPDSFITADFMLERLNGVLRGLVVNKAKMLENINATCGLVYSQRVLLELPKKGVLREVGYKIIQDNALKVWEVLQGEISDTSGENSVESEFDSTSNLGASNENTAGSNENTANLVESKTPELLSTRDFSSVDLTPNPELFYRLLCSDERLLEYMDCEEIAECFDPSYYMKNVDAIFARALENMSASGSKASATRAGKGGRK